MPVHPNATDLKPPICSCCEHLTVWAGEYTTGQSNFITPKTRLPGSLDEMWLQRWICPACGHEQASCRLALDMRPARLGFKVIKEPTDANED